MSSAAVIVGVGSAVAGAAVSAALKPNAPKAGQFIPVDAQAEQLKAISGNMAALPRINALATATNNANQAETDRMFPWFARLRDKGVKQAEDWISGKVDVLANLAKTAASNVGRGIAGSNFGFGVSLARADEYVTNMKLIGMDSASKWLAMSKSMTPQFDITSMFVKPDVSGARQERNDALRYENDAARYNYQNDPWNQFQSQTADVFGQAVKGFLSSGKNPNSTISKFEGYNAGGGWKLNPRTGFQEYYG